MKFFGKIFLVFLLSCSFLAAEAQISGREKRQLLMEADVLFTQEAYSVAVNDYLRVLTVDSTDPALYYKIGICYLNIAEDKLEALEFFKKCIKYDDKNKYEDVNLYLAQIFHDFYHFEEALKYYTSYLKTLDGKEDAKSKKDIKRQIEIVNNGIEVVSDSFRIDIINLGDEINTEFPDYSPVISADEDVLLYTSRNGFSMAGQYGGRANNYEKLYEKVYISRREILGWRVPEMINIKVDDETDIATVGLSSDGQKLLLYKGKKKSGNIHLTTPEGQNDWAPLSLWDANVNSKFWEGSASFPSDESIIYFSSNRPGGYGGRDIYRVVKQEDGTYGEPENLGPEINTEYDEDAPFIHPDKKTLYFSSTGHNSIGGYDIFVSKYEDSVWYSPRNMGFPINSTRNDIYFVVSADGKHGYFSSDRQGGYGSMDLYLLDMPSKNIPLTMVRGHITVGSPPKKDVPVKIKVIDKETGKRLRYVYNPNPKTGKYLMIFPPGKNYDMIVEAEGYLPHLLNIYIPNQSYFYELYQEIHLREVKPMDEVIGEKISVKNTFYDTKNLDQDTTLSPYDVPKATEFDPLLDLIGNLIETTDSLGMDEITERVTKEDGDEEKNEHYTPLLRLVEEIFVTGDTAAMAIIDEDPDLNERENVVFYGKDKAEGLQPVVFGKDTIYTTPAFQASDEAPLIEKVEFKILGDTTDTAEELPVDTVVEEEKPEVKMVEKREEVLSLTLYFSSSDYQLAKKQQRKIDKLVNFIAEHPDLEVFITGHTDNTGDDKANQLLSEKRAITVQTYFVEQMIDRGISAVKFDAKGLGESKLLNASESEEEKRLNRRVEISIVETKMVKEE